MQEQKGMFLSGLTLIFGLAITLASFFLILDPDVRNALGMLPSWFSPYVGALLIGRLIALTAIWNLRRWGVYALFLFELIELTVGIFVFTGVLTLPLRAIGSVAFIVLIFIWFLALRPKWHLYR